MGVQDIKIAVAAEIGVEGEPERAALVDRRNRQGCNRRRLKLSAGDQPDASRRPLGQKEATVGGEGERPRNVEPGCDDLGSPAHVHLRGPGTFRASIAAAQENRDQ